MDIAETTLTELTRRAREASRHAWAPYSKFVVGAAVLTDDGAIHGGANVENASYGLSMCAERNAIFQAVARGARRIVAIAVYTPTSQPTPPCGACRQVVAEFGPDALVICCTDDTKAERRFQLAELLPQAFSLLHP
jgi:cytidine deaminase